MEKLTIEQKRQRLKYLRKFQCPDSERQFVGCGGDAESGPITVTECRLCGKLFFQFGM